MSPHLLCTRSCNQHNRWSYFKYWLYLVEKDPDDFNGVEQYVWDLLRSGHSNDRIKWMPLDRSLCLEKSDKRYLSLKIADKGDLMKIAEGDYELDPSIQHSK